VLPTGWERAAHADLSQAAYRLDGPVADAVWKLFEIVISRRGPVPTLVEWDSSIPEWPVLRAEAHAARAILDRYKTIAMLENHHAAA